MKFIVIYYMEIGWKSVEAINRKEVRKKIRPLDYFNLGYSGNLVFKIERVKEK